LTTLGKAEYERLTALYHSLATGFLGALAIHRTALTQNTLLSYRSYLLASVEAF
jgi:hypothetical protein